MRQGKWDATSAHEWRCFKRVEKNREPYPSKTHFQLTVQPTGLMAQFFPNPQKSRWLKPIFFWDNLLLRVCRNNHGIQHVQINQQISLASRTGHHRARNLKGRHLVTVRILECYCSTQNRCFRQPSCQICFTQEKGISEELGREDVSPNNGRNLLSKEDYLSVELQLSMGVRDFLLFAGHYHKKAFLK